MSFNKFQVAGVAAIIAGAAVYVHAEISEAETAESGENAETQEPRTLSQKVASFLNTALVVCAFASQGIEQLLDKKAKADAEVAAD